MKIAVYSNDHEDSKLLLCKLLEKGYKLDDDITYKDFTYRVYIPEKNIFISHLCLEMHYSEYEENLIYATEYI